MWIRGYQVGPLQKTREIGMWYRVQRALLFEYILKVATILLIDWESQNVNCWSTIFPCRSYDAYEGIRMIGRSQGIKIRKSQGVKSGECAGHSKSPFKEIRRLGKCSRKKEMEIHAV